MLRSKYTYFAGFALTVGLATSSAHAQWTVTVLDPQPGSLSDSRALGAFGNQQVGTASSTAAIWSGTAGSWQLVQGPGFSAAEFLATSGTQQVGWTYMPSSSNHRAGLWSGTTNSFVDLNPSGAFESEALGISGSQQVGWAFLNGKQRAGLWNGTGASWVDLSPTFANESQAFATSGSQQVGYIINNTVGAVIACKWSGSAASYVNLNPSGSGNSIARGISGTQIVGYASTFDYGLSACVWTSSASSWVDIGHYAIGSDLSEALATDGSIQVGYVRFDNGNDTHVHAAAWYFPTDQWTDLHDLLPTEYTDSRATAIWSDVTTTRVAGYAYSATLERDVAILWTRSNACVAPTITQQPAPAEVCDGGSATFTVGASGTTPRTYQWQWRPPGEEFYVVMVNGSNIHPFTQQPIFTTPAVGGTSVTVNMVPGALGTGMGLRCLVSNACGSLYSNIVTLTPSASCCDSIDFNNDTSLFDPQDIEAFLSVYSEGPCIPASASCNDIDFNNDSSLFDPCDINSFLLVFSEGPCTGCGQ